MSGSSKRGGGRKDRSSAVRYSTLTRTGYTLTGLQLLSLPDHVPRPAQKPAVPVAAVSSDTMSSSGVGALTISARSRPLLTSLSSHAIQDFLALERDYQLELAQSGIPAVPLHALIAPSLLRVLPTLVDQEQADGRSTRVTLPSEDELAEELRESATAGAGESTDRPKGIKPGRLALEWERIVRGLLDVIVRRSKADAARGPALSIKDVDALVAKRLVWGWSPTGIPSSSGGRSSSLYDLHLGLVLSWTTVIAEEGLQAEYATSNGQRRAIRLLTDVLQPREFQNVVSDIVKRNEILTVGAFWRLLSHNADLQLQFTTICMMLQKRQPGASSGDVATSGNRRQTDGNASSSRDSGRGGGKAHKRGSRNRNDGSSGGASASATDGGDAVSTTRCWSCHQVGHVRSECPASNTSSVSTGSATTKNQAPSGAGSKATPTPKPSGSSGGRKQHGAHAAEAVPIDTPATAVDGVGQHGSIVFGDTTVKDSASVAFPAILDTGASKTFLSTAQAERLLDSGIAVSTRKLPAPLHIRIASGAVVLSDRVIVCPAVFRSNDNQSTSLSSLQLYVVPGFDDSQVLLGEPDIRALGLLNPKFPTRSTSVGTASSAITVESAMLALETEGNDLAAIPRIHVSMASLLDSDDDDGGLDDIALVSSALVNDVGDGTEHEGAQDDSVQYLMVPAPIDTTSDDVLAGIHRAVDTAVHNGLSTASADRLRTALCGPLRDVFRVGFTADPPARLTPVKFEFTAPFHSVRHQRRRYSATESVFMRETLEVLQQCGIVFRNPYARVSSPIQPVRKHGVPLDAPLSRQYRLVADFRGINAITAPMWGPLPLLDTVGTFMSRFRLFGSCDLINGYFQCPLDESVQEAFTISSDAGLFTMTRLPQGVKNAAVAFHGAVTSALGSLVGDCVHWYVDDGCVAATTEHELVDNWIRLFTRMNEVGLKVAIHKLVLLAGPEGLVYCGRKYSSYGSSVTPAHLSRLCDMTPPSTIGELRTFLASANWAREGVPRYAELVAPLQSLLTTALQSTPVGASKHAIANTSITSVGWSDEHLSAYRRVLDALQESLVIAYPRDTDDTHVFTDASSAYWAGLVTQCPVDDRELPLLQRRHRIIGVVSGGFRGSSLSWSILDKEAYSVLQTVLRHAHILLRPPEFILHVDNRVLSHVLGDHIASSTVGKPAAERLQRWAVTLRAFPMRVEWIPGDDNFFADMLSRFGSPHRVLQSAVLAVTTDSSSSGQHGAGVVTDCGQRFMVEDFPSQLEVTRAQQLAIVSRTLDTRQLGLRWSDASDGYVEGADRLYVVDTRHLRLRILIVAHAGPAGHRGVTTTLSNILQCFWWESVEQDTRAFVRTCYACVCTKSLSVVPRPLGQQLHGTRPGEVISCDFMYVRKPSRGSSHQFSQILTIIDTFSRYVSLTPAETADAATAVSGLLDWSSRFGPPSHIVSDRGSHFTAQLVQQLTKRLRIHHQLTTAYAAWTHGRVERVHRQIREILSAMLIDARLDRDEWVWILPVVCAVINQSGSSVLGGRAPVEVFLGRTPTSPVTLIYRPGEAALCDVPLKPEAYVAFVEQFHQRLSEIRDEVAAADARQHQVRRGEKPVDWTIGDFVLVSSAMDGMKEKLSPKFYGPYRVVGAEHNLVFEVESLVTRERRHVHASFLRRYADKDLEVTDQLKEYCAYTDRGYALEHIVSHRVHHGQHQLLVQWEDQDITDATWEPLERVFADAPSVVKQYIRVVADVEEREKLSKAIQQ
jgi:transposase InsO family protein